MNKTIKFAVDQEWLIRNTCFFYIVEHYIVCTLYKDRSLKDRNIRVMIMMSFEDRT